MFSHWATFTEQLLDKQYSARYCVAIGSHQVWNTDIQIKNYNTMSHMFRIFRLKLLWGGVLHLGEVREISQRR